MWAKRRHGFTIVELLVVVVVISVLASVTVVAYGGIRQQSEDAKIVSTVRGIVNMVDAYAALNDGKVPQASWACVGEPSDFLAENGYAAEWCHQPYQDPATIPSGSDHPINTATNLRFTTIVKRMPSSRIPEVDLGSGLKYRGILYDSKATQNNNKAMLQFYVNKPRDSCPIGIKTYSTATYTQCEYYFTYVSETGL